MRQHIRVLSILILSSLLILSGCGVSIGPQTKTEWVITRPGHPAQVLKAKPILMLPEGASQPVEQDPSGGIWMPKEHFDALMKALPKPTEGAK